MTQGGEIFVPKIASSTITDIATLIGPHLAQKNVGIRPGEKLHETMIPADDARWTVEIEDRFIILASFARGRPRSLSAQRRQAGGRGFRVFER